MAMPTKTKFRIKAKAKKRRAADTKASVNLPLGLPEVEEAGGMDAMALVKLLYFAGAQKTYPLLFTDDLVTSQFEAAVGDLMQSVREQARPVILRDVFENVRNFMLQDLQKLQMATVQDPVGAADLEAELIKRPLLTLQSFVKGSYAAVLRAMGAFADGTTFANPDTCECDVHQAERQHLVTARKSDA